ncbi:MAG: orotate phosphoribosyltransferase [Dissulfurispiraceae bacterium]|nr:orotate phosphoribosyltransferase [Dissulfurispiraceae bacterium]
MENHRERLISLIYEKAFRYSPEPVFKLVSGRMSNYYFNCKAVTLDPEGMYHIGNIICDMLEGKDVNGIGGLTLGADPIANAAAYTSFLRKKPINAFVVRKNAKSHGTMQWIEGNVKSGDSVVVLDDVITTGKSTIEAINRIKEAGLEIFCVIALVDRQEGGYEAIREHLADDTPVFSVVTRDDVMKLYKHI